MSCKRIRHQRTWEVEIFLDIKVAHSKQGIFISHQKYVLDLVKETRKLGCKLINTPIEFNHGLCDVRNDSMVNRGAYKRLVGMLIYLMDMRPNISFIVDVVSIFMQNPKETHNRVVPGIMQYWKGNP